MYTHDIYTYDIYAFYDLAIHTYTYKHYIHYSLPTKRAVSNNNISTYTH